MRPSARDIEQRGALGLVEAGKTVAEGRVEKGTRGDGHLRTMPRFESGAAGQKNAAGLIELRSTLVPSFSWSARSTIGERAEGCQAQALKSMVPMAMA